jgi:hypothetical protein
MARSDTEILIIATNEQARMRHLGANWLNASPLKIVIVIRDGVIEEIKQRDLRQCKELSCCPHAALSCGRSTKVLPAQFLRHA